MEEKTRYSDAELEEFRNIINEKLALAKRDYDQMMDVLMNKDGNDVDDTSPTYKVLEEGSATQTKEELIQMAGGVNLGDDLDGEWIQISLEALLRADPDIILLGDSMYGATAEAASQRPGWSGISAVKNGKLFEFDDNLVTRPGPRLVNGFELIAKILHPELFQEP